MTKLKTHEQARAEFDRKGLSIAAWAREHQVGRSLVYEILAGRKKCKRGDSHKVAVLLGLKDGEIVSSAKQFKAPPAPVKSHHTAAPSPAPRPAPRRAAKAA